MPKDVLVRGIDDKTLAYLEEYRSRGRYWQKTSWSELIRGILREWAEEQQAREAQEQPAGNG